MFALVSCTICAALTRLTEQIPSNLQPTRTFSSVLFIILTAHICVIPIRLTKDLGSGSAQTTDRCRRRWDVPSLAVGEMIGWGAKSGFGGWVVSFGIGDSGWAYGGSRHSEEPGEIEQR